MKLFTPKELKSTEQLELDVLLSKEAAAAKLLEAKTQRLNELDVEYTRKIQERQRELDGIELHIRTATLGVQRNVEMLEERRRQALAPIDTEMQELQALRQSVDEAKSEVRDERHQLERLLTSLREREAEFTRVSLLTAKSQAETLDFLGRQQRDAESAMTTAKATLATLQEAKKCHAESLQALTMKEASAKKAEVIAKAAMVAADARIARELKEQKTTDEKRKMLALAIKVLKGKGLWDAALKTVKDKKVRASLLGGE